MAKCGHYGAIVLSLSLALSSAPRPLWAGGAPAAPPTAAELSSARKLFAEGLKAEDQGRWAEALALFERVRAIVVSPAVYYHIAVSHEELSHVVEALNAFELAIQEAERKHDSAVLKESRDHIEALRPRAASLTVNLPEDAEAAQITLDDQPINAALAGTSMLIDPGVRHLVVTARNYPKTFDVIVNARASESSVVTANLGGKIAPLSAPASALSLASAAPSQPPHLPPGEPNDRVSIFVAGGATVALGAGALIVGLVAHGKYEAYQEQNKNPMAGSFAERRELRGTGQALAATSTVMTVAALIGAGVTTFLLLRKPKKQPSAMMCSPWVGLASAGVSLGGSL